MNNFAEPTRFQRPAQHVPVVLPWHIRLLAAIAPVYTQKLARQMMLHSTSSVIEGVSKSPYEQKLASQWRSGGTRGGRADPITNTVINGRDIQAASWTHRAGGNGNASAPMDRRRGLDRRPNNIPGMSRRPFYMPRDEQLEQIHSATGQRCDDTRDTLSWGASAYSAGPNHSGRAPARIPRMHRPGLALMAGPHQFGTMQTWGSNEKNIVMSPRDLQVGMKSRGIRSVRGVLFGNKQGSGLERIPAIFTPTSVK